MYLISTVQLVVLAVHPRTASTVVPVPHWTWFTIVIPGLWLGLRPGQIRFWTTLLEVSNLTFWVNDLPFGISDPLCLRTYDPPSYYQMVLVALWLLGHSWPKVAKCQDDVNSSHRNVLHLSIKRPLWSPFEPFSRCVHKPTKNKEVPFQGLNQLHTGPLRLTRLGMWPTPCF